MTKVPPSVRPAESQRHLWAWSVLLVCLFVFDERVVVRTDGRTDFCPLPILLTLKNIYFRLGVFEFFGNSIMEGHEFIQGFHDGHDLLYFPSEDHLFYQSHVRAGQVEYTCYEKCRPGQYASPEGQSPDSKCTAKVIVKDGKSRRNQTRHTKHENHGLIFRDLQTLNTVKDKCRKLSEWCPLSSSKVSAKELLSIELAKWVFSFRSNQ